MPDLLRFIRILAKLTQGIINMSSELDALKAAVADQSAHIADQSTKIDALLAIPRADPADAATIAEIASTVASNGAAIDANTAKIGAVLTPVA